MAVAQSRVFQCVMSCNPIPLYLSQCVMCCNLIPPPVSPFLQTVLLLISCHLYEFKTKETRGVSVHELQLGVSSQSVFLGLTVPLFPNSPYERWLAGSHFSPSICVPGTELRFLVHVRTCQAIVLASESYFYFTVRKGIPMGVIFLMLSFTFYWQNICVI